MASLWKDPRTKFLVACFTDKDGKRAKRSTKETDPKKAQKIADSYERVARTKQTAKTVRNVVADLSQQLWGAELVSPTVSEHINIWLEEKRIGAAASTVDFYENSTERFLTFLGDRADTPIENIDRALIAKFKVDLSKSLASKTVNNHLKLLKAVFKAARRDGAIDDDPTEFVDTVKRTSNSVRRPFTKDELKRVLAACDDEWKSMVIFGIYTGQRLADVADLRWGNIDLEKSEIRLVTRKTKRSLMIPISPPLGKHLKTLAKAADKTMPLHPQSAATLGRLNRAGPLSNQFAAVLVKAGLRDVSTLSKKSTGKGREGKRQLNELSFHSLRHTAVTLLKEAGVAMAVVMEMIGHDSEQMSEHYTHVGDEALKKAADALPDVLA